MIRAYPFHPALIEALRDRWGSISGFQRTRGVLRLPSEAKPCPLRAPVL